MEPHWAARSDATRAGWVERWAARLAARMADEMGWTWAWLELKWATWLALLHTHNHIAR